MNALRAKSGGQETSGTPWKELGARTKPALVDINMPVMNGEEMIRRIRGNPETVALPVVVVSTEGSETRIGALLRDKVGFVHKPFTPEQLGQIISQMTGVCDEQPDGEVSLPGSGLDF